MIDQRRDKSIDDVLVQRPMNCLHFAPLGNRGICSICYGGNYPASSTTPLHHQVMTSLPQPPQPAHGDSPYIYITHDELETDWLGDPVRLRTLLMGGDNVDGTVDTSDGTTITNERYSPGTLVWVLLSKGKQHSKSSNKNACNSLMLHKKRRDKKNKRREEKNGVEDGSEDNAKIVEVKEAAGDTTTTEQGKHNAFSYHSKSEMFLRARVVSDTDEIEESNSEDEFGSAEKRMQRRILVRYSKGATYHVRAYNLIPGTLFTCDDMVLHRLYLLHLSSNIELLHVQYLNLLSKL